MSWKSGRKNELTDHAVRGVFQGLEKWLLQRVGKPPLDVRNGAAQSVATSTTTKTSLILDTVLVSNPQGKITFDGTSTWVPDAGVWEVSCVVEWAFNATGYRYLSLLNNATAAVQNMSLIQAAPTLLTEQFAAVTIVANGTDDYKIQGRQNSGATLNMTPTETKWKWLSE